MKFPNNYVGASLIHSKCLLGLGEFYMCQMEGLLSDVHSCKKYLTMAYNDTYLKKYILLDLINFSSKAAVGDGIDDDWFVRFRAWFLKKFRTFRQT